MSIFNKKPEGPYVSAVVAAAGSSARMYGADKQFVPLSGVPVLARSIAALSACPRIREIVLVCREDQLVSCYDLVRLYELDLVKTVIKGGPERQASVELGIAACSEKAEYYAVHDGARPLVDPACVELCIDLAVKTGAAAVGVPVTDTIKMCDENGTVLSTPNRDRLWAVQTPQIFESGLFRRALNAAKGYNRVYTDDCQLVESLGHAVTMSPGNYGNIKITYPQDIAAAEAILAYLSGEDFGEGI